MFLPRVEDTAVVWLSRWSCARAKATRRTAWNVKVSSVMLRRRYVQLDLLLSIDLIVFKAATISSRQTFADLQAVGRVSVLSG
jgi:hypothetical protein